MASVFIEEQNRTITDPKEIIAFLAPHGIVYEHWQVEGRLREGASDEEILQEYSSEIEQVKQAGGYVTADVINVKPDTPNLDAMLSQVQQRAHPHRGRSAIHGCGKGDFSLAP
jgi:1,2-dihydroxy-3-keto-5-methylthiopentene dioxygenase